MKKVLVVLATCGALLGARSASAFCGFYVGGGEAKLFNNATQVVLLRDGTRTVLSMQNNYQGPPSDFAMVVPVPVVLQKENVKTLEKAVFDRVDQITSPRLVEYWEQDPCPRYDTLKRMGAGGPPLPKAMPSMAAEHATAQVKIEAQFVVGEYDIVILSATDAMALDTWLRQNKYNIPAGAEPYLRPYVQQGMKFFVAKVDATKVKFENGMAALSPLRFHYDSEQFHLPIRLGLINSQGSQDLIVNLLGRNQRYDVTNYENVAVPTNIDVADATRNQFGAFYTKLFEQTLAKHPRAVITEYAWQATSCDPCPTQPLSLSELQVLGADVAPSMMATAQPPVAPGGPGGGPIGPGGPMRRPPPFYGGSDFVLTRLHVRYTKDALGDDLFFRTAPPIVGGREHVVGANGKLEEGAVASGTNNFQARYVIRHPWTGAITCKDPQRGMWGGPPGGGMPRPTPAAGLGLTKSGAVQLAALVKGTLPVETFLSAATPTPALAIAPTSAGDAGAMVADAAPPETDGSVVPPPPPLPAQGGCAGCATGGDPAGTAALGAAVAFVLAALRRRRRA